LFCFADKMNCVQSKEGCTFFLFLAAYYLKSYILQLMGEMYLNGRNV
jgi:hypothetical protein